MPVTFYAMVRAGQPVQVGVEDRDGHVAAAQGPVPEAAVPGPSTVWRWRPN